jgi:hypothetical protein
MVVTFRNAICPSPPQLSLHTRAALSSNSNGTWSVYNRKNPKSSLYFEMSMFYNSLVPVTECGMRTLCYQCNSATNLTICYASLKCTLWLQYSLLQTQSSVTVERTAGQKVPVLKKVDMLLDCTKWSSAEKCCSAAVLLLNATP